MIMLIHYYTSGIEFMKSAFECQYELKTTRVGLPVGQIRCAGFPRF